MAKIEVDGMAEFQRAVLKLGEEVEDVVPKVLKAGAGVLKEAEIKQVKKTFRSDRTTGALAKSIKCGRVKKANTGSGYYIEVYPQGRNSDGERNATVGFVQEYGRSNMPAHPWKSIAEQKAEGEVQEKMQEAFSKELDI